MNNGEHLRGMRNEMTISDRDAVADGVFGFCYGMAMVDAIRRTRAAVRDERATTVDDSMKDVYLKNESARERVRCYIESILIGAAEDPVAVIEDVEKLMGYEEFTFGNAQKLVNMTAKYIFVSTYADSDLRTRFNACHCPMDGAMLKKAKDIYGSMNMQDKEKIDRLLEGTEWEHRPKSLLNEPWSRATAERPQYKVFQGIIRMQSQKEGFSPLEYDIVHWKQ